MQCNTLYNTLGALRSPTRFSACKHGSLLLQHHGSIVCAQYELKTLRDRHPHRDPKRPLQATNETSHATTSIEQSAVTEGSGEKGTSSMLDL